MLRCESFHPGSLLAEFCSLWYSAVFNLSSHLSLHHAPPLRLLPLPTAGSVSLQSLLCHCMTCGFPVCLQLSWQTPLWTDLVWTPVSRTSWSHEAPSVIAIKFCIWPPWTLNSITDDMGKLCWADKFSASPIQTYFLLLPLWLSLASLLLCQIFTSVVNKVKKCIYLSFCSTSCKLLSRIMLMFYSKVLHDLSSSILGHATLCRVSWGTELLRSAVVNQIRDPVE